MTQYEYASSVDVKDKDGDITSITPFRTRNKYVKDLMIGYTANQQDETRPDIRVMELYGSFAYIGVMIDANSQDIFSLKSGDRYYMPLGGAAIG